MHCRGRRTEPDRRTRHFGGTLEIRGARLEVTEVPGVDEADVVQVLPPMRRESEALLQQCNGLIGAAGARGRRLREEDRAKPVGDIESRIEGRDEIEQWMQQVVVLVRILRQRLAAEVDDGADPEE